MARYQYVCRVAEGGCGNTIEASQIDRRLRGSKEVVRIMLTPVCDCNGVEMAREPYTPPRREVSSR